MKRAVTVILTLVLIAACLAGCGNKTGDSTANSRGGFALTGKDISSDKVQIAFIPMSTAGQVNVIVQQAADKIMDTYPNIAINFFDAGFDPNTQITLINECITQKYDAIVMECVDATALAPVIKEAEDAGVVVITSNMGCDAIHTLHIESDSYQGGWVSGEALIKMLGGKGKILLIDVPAPIAVTTTFCKGFEDYSESFPDVEILEYVNLGFDAMGQEGAYNMMRDLLTKYDEINAVYTPDDNFALGVIQAINEAGRKGEGILVWGTEIQPGGIEAVLSGELTGSCWTDRYGSLYNAFSYAVYFAQTGINSKALGYSKTPSIFSGFVAVTRDNIEDILPLTRWPGY